MSELESKQELSELESMQGMSDSAKDIIDRVINANAFSKQISKLERIKVAAAFNYLVISQMNFQTR